MCGVFVCVILRRACDDARAPQAAAAPPAWAAGPRPWWLDLMGACARRTFCPHVAAVCASTLVTVCHPHVAAASTTTPSVAHSDAASGLFEAREKAAASSLEVSPSFLFSHLVGVMLAGARLPQLWGV